MTGENEVLREKPVPVALLYRLLYFVWLFDVPTAPSGPGPAYCRGFTITLRHTMGVRTSLGEQLARRRELCLTKHNTPKR